MSAVLAARYRGQHEIVSAILAADSELDVFDGAAVGAVDRLIHLLDGEPTLARAYASDGLFPLGPGSSVCFSRRAPTRMCISTAGGRP